MTITIDHEGSCGTPGCANAGLVFDAPSVDGVVGQIVCGVCGVNFTDRCTPKGE